MLYDLTSLKKQAIVAFFKVMKDLCNKAKSAKKRQSTLLFPDFNEFSRPQIIF